MRLTISAGGVVVNRKGQVVVVNQNGSSWSLPKGHVENGEDNLTAAKREIYEETGIKDLKLIKEFESYKRHKMGQDGKGNNFSEMKTLHFFLFSTETDELKPIDPDNPEARWVDKEDVATLLSHKKDKEFFLKIKNTI